MDWLSLFVSLKLALAVTAVLTVVTAPIAGVLTFTAFPGKSFLEVLLNLPMALPPTVMGFYLIVAMGPKGIAGGAWERLTGGSLLFTFPGIVAAAAVCGLPYALQPMKAAFMKIDRRLLENAWVLGLTRTESFFRVVLPNSIGGLAAAAILVFLHTMGAFGVLLMVGGSVPGVTKVAAIAIYEAVETMNYRHAALMSLCLIPVSYLFLWLVNRLNGEDV
jgi:molybdate transport system permease protein